MWLKTAEKYSIISQDIIKNLLLTKTIHSEYKKLAYTISNTIHMVLTCSEEKHQVLFYTFQC